MRLSRVLSCVIIAAVATCAAAAPAPDEAAQPGYHYHYYKERRPLALDVARIAVRASDPAATANAALALGIDPATLQPHPIAGWHLVPVPAQAAPEALVAAFAAEPGVEFASPVFTDDLGGPIFIAPRLHVGFVPGLLPAARAAAIARAKAGTVTVRDYLPDVDRLAAASRSGLDLLAAANALAADPSVTFAEPELVVRIQQDVIPNDTMFGDLWGLHNTGQAGGTADRDMDGPEAWDVTTGSNTIIAVVIDSGVDLTHPDLNLAPGADFTSDASTTGAPVNSCDNHGTLVAGCIAARINNALGVTGVAPACRVAPVRISISNIPCDGFGSTTLAWLSDGILWAQTIGARVTNNSNGIPVTSALVETSYTTTRNAGVVHFAASGNNGSGTIDYPASFPIINAVGAVTRTGVRASFSQHGTGLDFCAPGQDIATTDRAGAAGTVAGDYNTGSGTSLASPYAAGIACLVLSKNPGRTAAQVEAALVAGCADLGPAGYDTEHGHGFLNARAALDNTPLPGPANDACAGAVAVGLGATNGTLVGAGNEFDYGPVCGSAGAAPDAWYSFTAPAAGTLTVTTCGTNDTGGTDLGMDTVLTLHAACGAPALDCNDDGAPGACGGADGGTLRRDSVLSRQVAAGQTLLVRVARFGNAVLQSTFVLNVGFVPANDTCANATNVSAGGTFTGTLVGAGNETNFMAICGSSATNADIWYTFTAPACPGTLTLSTCGTHDAGGLNAGVDTVLSIHDACASAAVACNDDGSDFGDPCGAADDDILRDSFLTRPLAGGQTVLIRLSRFGAAAVAPGPVRLNVAFAPAANDECAGALNVGNGVTSYCSTTATTSAHNVPVCGPVGPRTFFRDLWFRYTPARSGRFTVRNCGQASWDTLLAAYASCPAAPGGAAACSDDACDARRSSITLQGVAGVPVLLRLGSFSDEGGSGAFTILCSADFDANGLVEVADIFAFLSAWFATTPAAEYDNVAGIAVSDIFAFLSAWFAGC